MAGKEDEALFYPAHAGSASALSKYQNRLMCIDQAGIELSGDSNSESGRKVRFALEACNAEELEEGLACKEGAEAAAWLRQQYIIVLAN